MRRNLSWEEALPRVVADFVIVHASMVGALAISVAYQLVRGSWPEAHELITTFQNYYIRFFWLLSPIFPLTFAANGFYTHTRSYGGWRKKRVLLQGLAIAVLLFCTVNWLIFNTTTGRSVTVPFAVLVSVGVCLSRFLKNYVENRFDVKPKSTTTSIERQSHILIVGGAGYIGSLLAERLLRSGYKVRVLDALLYGREALRTVENHPQFELMTGDCRNMQDMIRATRGVRAIVDLAAIVGDPACEQDREAALAINYGATRMLIEVAKGHGVERFLFASSCSVYGASEVEVDERSKVNPISVYAQTKVESERALLAARSEAFHPTILRFATVFGLGYRPRFDLVVNLLSARAKQDGKITIFNGEQWRPFIHVRDVVEAIVLALEVPVRLVSGEIFNVGDSKLNHTLQQVAEIIHQVFPGTEIEHIANTDKRNYRVNFDKVRNRLSFESERTVLDGVTELKSAFDDRFILDYKDLRYHNQRFLEVAGVVRNKDEVDALVMAAFAQVA
jgi:nucleoside-diphosphate-sugar epimerase